jgi:hypothetical protein
LKARVRKLVGLVAILAFMLAYVIVAVSVADLLPSHRLIELVYFVVVGTGWFVPMIPLVKWMNRGG